MSKGLGKTQCAVLEKVVSWSYGIEIKYLHRYLSLDYKKASISRAIKSLEDKGYIVREQTHSVKTGSIGENREDIIKPTSRGLLYWSERTIQQNQI